MRLFSKLESSEANGVGTRAVIWFAGCTLNCTGCHNPETHSFNVADTPIAEVENWIKSLSGVEGITFSGGEPMQHYSDLLRLCKFIREVRPDLSIGMFTGYSIRELALGRWQYFNGSEFQRGSILRWSAVRNLIDFAVCGRYNKAQATNKMPLCGSANQRLICFTDRYKVEDFAEQTAEVTISDGLVQITGFPGTEFLNSLTEVM